MKELVVASEDLMKDRLKIALDGVRGCNTRLCVELLAAFLGMHT